MDRHVFLLSQPWLHGLGETATQDGSDDIDEGEEWLTAALSYEFKVEKLFSGVCCLHLPLPEGLVVTPTSHCLFFEEGARELDPAQLRLQLWVITHLLHRTTSICAVFDGKPLQLDHTQCELLQTFGRGEVNGRPTPAFIRMSFGAVALQLWHPLPLSGSNDPSVDKAATAANAASSIAADGQPSAATPATSGSGSEGDDVQRLEEVGQKLKNAVSNKPFVPRKLPLAAAAAGVVTTALPEPASSGVALVDAAHARVASAEGRRVALLRALRSLADSESVAATSADGASLGQQQHSLSGPEVRSVSSTLQSYCDARLTKPDIAAALSDIAELQATRWRLLQCPHDRIGPPQWPASDDGDEEAHADAEQWRKEEETQLLLQMAQGVTHVNE